MKIRQLLELWQSGADEPPHDCNLCLDLKATDRAKLAALSELYGRDVQTLGRELLEAALLEIEEAMPYLPGREVIGEDEFGDPIYEDAGPTPRFLKLTRAHLKNNGG